jgi:acid phosphatase (class A)
MFPEAAGTFSCALGIPITESRTHRIIYMLAAPHPGRCRALHLHRQESLPAQARVHGERREPICTPEEEEKLRKDGSYPSGHTAIGWAWALILTEIAPERADAILARGRAFGESRVVCNVHWHSDVVAGRFMGAAAVARLHADPGFRAELEAAITRIGSRSVQEVMHRRATATVETEALSDRSFPEAMM